MVCSLAAYDRPEYLALVLDSLQAAAERLDEPLRVVASLDPSPRAPEMLALLERLDDVHLNPERLGCAANTRRAIERAFAVADDDFILHLEDDLVLAPDALALAAWLRDEYRSVPEVICVGLKSVWKTSPGDEYLVRRTSWFGCHNPGTWRAEWERDFLPGWEQLKEGEPGYRGWDVAVNDRIMRGRVQAIPLLSRSQHIGRHGTFANGASYPPSIAPDWEKALRLPPGHYREREGAILR